jgi:hypothetical protein
MAPNAKKNLIGLNLDSYVICNSSESDERAQKWSYDTASTTWHKNIIQLLNLPLSPMKINRGSTDSDVMSQISRSIGVLVSPDKRDGTWWNYCIIQALNSNTPVVTDWKESGVLGDAWSVLAYSIEEMSQSKRDLVAMAQRESYRASIPTQKGALKILEETLGIGK